MRNSRLNEASGGECANVLQEGGSVFWQNGCADSRSQIWWALCNERLLNVSDATDGVGNRVVHSPRRVELTIAAPHRGKCGRRCNSSRKSCDIRTGRNF